MKMANGLRKAKNAFIYVCPWGLVTASPIFRYRAARVAKNYTVLLALKAIL